MLAHARALLSSTPDGATYYVDADTDRAKPGSKHHLICDGNGIPPAVTLSGGNRNDVT